MDELSHVVDALPGLVWTARPDGTVDFLNQRWCAYTGLSLEKGQGEGWQAAIHGEDLPEMLERWRSGFASSEPGEMEARLRRCDGTYRWFLISISPMRDAAGHIIRWLGVGTDIEDRKRAEEALRLRELNFRLIVDSIPAPVAVTTPEGEVEGVNQPTLDYFGKTLDELKSWKSSDAVHPDDLPQTIAAQRKAHELGRPYNVESRHRRADGVYRWFNVLGLPLRDTDGRILRWFHLQIDIDDRKRAEDLLASEKRLLEMVAGGRSQPRVLEALCQHVEATAAGCYCSVVLVDPTGTHLENGAAPSLPASFITSIIGRPVNAGSGPCGMASYLNEQVIAADLTTERRWEEWCPMALAYGLRACWSTPITSAAGKVLGAFALYYDTPRAPTPLHQSLIERFTHIARIVIENAQNDAALKSSEAFLAEVQHLSSTGSFRWNAVTGERTWSEEMYHIFEFDPAAPVSIEMMETRIHPEDLAAFRERGQRVRNVDADFEFEHRLLMPDGSIKYIRATCHPRRYDGTLVELFGTVHDVTQRRLAEEALDKVRSELAHVARVTTLGVLTGSIAHEVNQPLSGIVTNASTCLRMLAAEPPNVDGARETARRTIRDANRASDVITRLRALFAKKSAMSESLDLNEATREVVALSSDELQRNRVILREELADDLPLVTGDRIQLQQVILNLLRNASDAMSGVDDRPRELMIKTEREEDDRVRLTVQDAGMGFDAHATDKLFEAFYTTKSDGMGIGLSVSRSIIEGHSGRLWAVANDGPGATFAFSIPLVPAPRTSRSAAVRTAVRANPERSIGQP